MPPLLSAAGITKTFRRQTVPSALLQDRLLKRSARETWEVRALDGVDLEVGPGEWLGLYGPNGSGKTTLLRILADLMTPDAGTVRCDCTLSCFLSLGVGFHPERTAEENIDMHGILHGRSRKEIRSLTERVIAFAGVESHRDVPLKCFSTGMQLRLGFAAAVAIDAELYLFDEVLAVGDAAFQERSRAHLAAMRRSGKAAVVVGHDLARMRSLTDRVVFLDHGRLVPEAAVGPRGAGSR